MISGEALAKINFGLRVGSAREDGFHPVAGVFQSVEIADRLRLESAESDTIVSSQGSPVAEGLDNLAFRAVAAVRSAAGSEQRMRVILDKTTPAAAGLGGGSADAAAGLALAGRHFGVGSETLVDLAPQLGSDVPFCLVGGTAMVSGRGEKVERLPALGGFALAVVVPPIELSTPEAFRQWDDLGEPEGPRVAQRDLPPGLREFGDLQNDLYPAAIRIAPELDDWREGLEQAWGRPVAMSGSGPSLYGFFLDTDEAASAVSTTPVGARYAEACGLAPVGWRMIDE